MRWNGKWLPHWHFMRNLSTGSTHRYCVRGQWNWKTKTMERCQHTDEKA